MDIQEEIRKANDRIATTEKQRNISSTDIFRGDEKANEVSIETGAEKLPSLSTTSQPFLASKSDTASRTKPNSRTKTETDQRDKAESRYTQLKSLYDFMTAELAHVLELRKRIADGTITCIRFDDLWHMFSPGERVLSDKNGHKQLYTIYAVTGGLPLLRKPHMQEILNMNYLRDRVCKLIHQQCLD